MNPQEWLEVLLFRGCENNGFQQMAKIMNRDFDYLASIRRRASQQKSNLVLWQGAAVLQRIVANICLQVDICTLSKIYFPANIYYPAKIYLKKDIDECNAGGQTGCNIF